MAESRKRAFLSHSAANQELAQLVRSLATGAGFDVMPEAGAMEPGVNVADGLRESIAAADLVIFLATPHALDSDWLPFEVGMARALDRPVVVLFEGIRREQLPVYLSEFEVSGVSQAGEALRKASAALQCTAP